MKEVARAISLSSHSHRVNFDQRPSSREYLVFDLGVWFCNKKVILPIPPPPISGLATFSKMMTNLFFAWIFDFPWKVSGKNICGYFLWIEPKGWKYKYTAHRMISRLGGVLDWEHFKWFDFGKYTSFFYKTYTGFKIERKWRMRGHFITFENWWLFTGRRKRRAWRWSSKRN